MDRYAIIGLGRFGYRLAVMLAEAGAEVIAIDRDRQFVEDIRDSVTLAIAMDGTDENALRAQGIDKVDVAVVGIGQDFEAAVLSTVVLKQLGVPRVVTRATTDVRGEILRRVGADALVNPEEESAHRWTHRLLGPQVIEQIELAEGQSLVQVPVPLAWVNKTLADLEVRRRFHVNVVAVRREVPHTGPEGRVGTRTVIEVPLPSTLLQKGDVLVLIGDDEQIAALPR